MTEQDRYEEALAEQSAWRDDVVRGERWADCVVLFSRTGRKAKFPIGVCFVCLAIVKSGPCPYVFK